MSDVLRFARRHPGRVPVLAMLVFLAVFLAVNPGLLTPFQMATSVNVMAPLVLAALAQYLVITTGGIDLSIAGLMSLVNVVFVQLAMALDPTLAVLIAVAAAALCGFVNGCLVGLARLPSVVVTLSTSFIFTALAVVVQDRPGGMIPFEFMTAATGLWFGVFPGAALWLGLSCALVAFTMHRTVIGRIIFAVGRGDLGLRAVGHSPALARIAGYTFAGALAGGAAVLLAISAASGDPRSGLPYLLNSIAAVAIGGAVFSGREATVLGVFAGATILALLDSLLFFVGVSGAWKYIIGGGIIVLTVLVPALARMARGPHRRDSRASAMVDATGATP